MCKSESRELLSGKSALQECIEIPLLAQMAADDPQYILGQHLCRGLRFTLEDYMLEAESGLIVDVS